MAASLGDAISDAPDVDVVLVDRDRRWSTKQLANEAARLAAGLADQGIGPGDRVAFSAPVAAQTVVAYRACWHIGAVAAGLHADVGGARADALADVLAPSATIATPGSPLRSPPGTIEIDPEGLAPIPDDAPAPVVVGAGEPALVLFTSGSSGTPKGVVHTYGSLAAKAIQSLDVHGLGPDDTVLMPAPLAHVSGLLHGVLIPAVGGVRAVLMARWDPGEALDQIEREQVTYMVGPPTFFLDLMDHAAFDRDRVRSLRFLSCGGTGVTPAFIERATAELGCLVKRSYGSTEAPTVTTSRNDDPIERVTITDGRAHGATELRIGDGGPGEDGVGEVFVRGPEVAAGYLDPADTAAAFIDGWLRTGDLGRLDDGWLTITGRVGDGIIRGGENIDPAEVEQILESHPRVRRAVVVGVPDRRLGERVAAALEVDGRFEEAECARWFSARGVGRLLAPEHLAVFDRLPRLASGKPDRAAVRHALMSRQ